MMKAINRLRTRYTIILFLFLGFIIEVNGQNEILDKEIKFPRAELELKELLQVIEQITDMNFSYDPTVINVVMKIKLPKNPISSRDAFSLLGKSHGIKVIDHGNVIILQQMKNKKRKSVIISGTVRDSLTGEFLPGAQVLSSSGVGVVSNQYGFYSIPLEFQADEKLMIRYLGYDASLISFVIKSDTVVEVQLTPTAILLEDIIISGDGEEVNKDVVMEGGNYSLSAMKIKETISFAGEPDAIKILQFLPGVQSGNEGTTNLSIRGGSSDQNLFLLDEAPVYNPSHALSFFSIFNPDALQSVTLYKSAIPAMYGGRLSSVVDVRMKEGNRLKRKYSGAVGTIASRLTVEGPVSGNNDKASFMLSGRYGYAGQVVNGIYLLGAIFSDPTANRSTLNNKIGFFDFNGKLNYRKDSKNHFFISVYSGYDNFYFNHITSGYSLSWGNSTATFRWNHVHNPKLFSNTTVLFSNYSYQYRILNNTRYYLWSAGFKELALKRDYEYFLNEDNTLSFGFGMNGHWINPGTVEPRSKQAVTETYSLADQTPIGANIYFSNAQSFGEHFKLNFGLRYSNFAVKGGGMRYKFQENADEPFDSVQFSKHEIQKVFHRLEPRLSITYKHNSNSFVFSYDRMSQYFHLLANSSVGLPTDLWMPSGGGIEPQMADIFSINYHRLFRKSFEGSVGVYYKTFDNILDFKDNANLFVNRYVESQLLQGIAKAYGLETFFQKSAGNFTGSISYTASKATNSIAGVNGGKPFPSRYDKRHNFSITGKSILSKTWEFSFNFVYTTGGALTVPSGNFVFDGVVFNDFTTRNGFRLPDYHRLDISFRYNSSRNDHRKFKRTWSFDIYNAYGRKNPFTIYSQQEDHGFTRTDVKAIYLFRVVPTVTYNFSF
jgi:hypothetical protein